MGSFVENVMLSLSNYIWRAKDSRTSFDEVRHNTSPE